MNTKSRMCRALGFRVATVQARFRAERNLGGWKRSQRAPVSIGTRLPVIFCTWRRLDLLPRTLELLAGQEVPVQAYIWNNSSDYATVDSAVTGARMPVTVHHSSRNIGGFGRFYLAREAAEAGHDKVIFIDDDQEFGPTMVGDLLKHHRPLSLSGWWAFKFSGDDYGTRSRVEPGEAAAYIGTGGMITDTAVFSDQRLFQCPRRFWFVEDLWLCYVASRLAGYDMFRSLSEFQTAEDGHALYLSLGRTKWNFLRYLIRQGWDLTSHRGAGEPDCRGQGVGTPGP
jgi:hypothetical protein